MKGQVGQDTFVYSVDANDVIAYWGGNLVEFAYANDWSSGIAPEKVVGHPLFEFITGPETVHLYRILFDRCRSGKEIGPIPFRCDSPTERRFLELHLSPAAGGSVIITNKLLRVEQRPAVTLLMGNIARNDEFLRICSMCKKIALNENLWAEAEEALGRLGVFEKDRPPQLTHGLCKSCFDLAMSALEPRGA